MVLQTPDLQVVQEFGIALLIGALVGLEREKRKTGTQTPSFAGIRTFILVSEAGALSAWLSIQAQMPLIFAVALAGLCVHIAVAYVLEKRADPASVGITTELAGVVVFLLGAAVMFGQASIAIGLAVINTALLALKGELHGVVQKLDRDDIYAGIKLLISSFIVLPLLPNEAIDPWHALNPYKLWLLVILISGLSLVGYVATRSLGQARGVAVTGLTGGLVSSTAVTLSMARESREAGREAMAVNYASGILLSWLVMFFRVILMVAVLRPSLLLPLMWPVGAMLVVNIAFVIGFYLRGTHHGGESVNEVPLRNPFSLWSASKFGLLFAVVLLLVEVSRQSFSASSVVWVGAFAGLTDVDAITLSMADFAKNADMVAIAVQAIVAAILANTLTKCGLAAGLGSGGLARRIVPASLAMGLAGGLGLLWV